MTALPRPAFAANIDTSAATRTLLAWAACALGVLPLGQMFTDHGWVRDVYFTMFVVMGPAAALRLWWRPRALHTWVGLLLAMVWLTVRFFGDSAIGGVVPGRDTWRAINDLFDDLHRTTTDGVAPVHTTTAIIFTLCLVMALVAALVDLLAVVARHGGLAGVPLLVIFTVGGAVPRHPVNWLLFVPAAIGFLILLSLDAREEIRSWGRLMPRPGESRPAAAALAISGQRIAVVAVAIAVVLPLLAPSRPTNLIANALHHSSGSGSGGGSGFGAGGVSIDPFAALKGQLKRPKATKLFTVTLNPATERQAFYLRTNVLTNITEKGWVAGNHGATEPVSTTSYPVTPDNQIFVDSESFVATIKIAALGGNAPVFGRPIEVNGLPGDTQWSPQDELLLGPGVHRDDTFQETVTQPNPSPAQLGAAGVAPDAQLAPFLAVPASLPASVHRLTERLIAGKDGDYDRARAISDYFTNPKNGFTYSLETVRGDSGSDLVDFLTNKTGFCQQYAAAMGILLRLAGVPARVVLGYTHGPADASGQFTVSTDDAHAWVEAYFGGLGWIPFDPTPDAGIFGGAKSNLPWAPRPQAQPGQSTITGSGSATTKPKEARPSGADGASGSFNTNSGSSTLEPLLWTALVLAVLALAGLIPAAVRWRRRRRRLRAARAGDPDPLWAELSDTAIDLGYVWSPARTPRQVVGWLAGQTRTSEGSLQAIATAVEQARYAPPRDGVDRADSTVLLAELRTVEAAMRRRRRRGLRVKARLFPQSLGWRLPRGARRR